MSSLVQCKTCEKEIAKGVKKCPHCGKDQRSWIMRHKILSFIGFIVLLSVIGGALGEGDEQSPVTTASNSAETGVEAETEGTGATETPEEVKEPTVVSVGELLAILEENALKAENTYNDQYVEVTGQLENIDSDGSYFSLAPTGEDFVFTGVTIDIEEEHAAQVMEFTPNQQVTVVGTITDIGEIIGYRIAAETIK